jgi:TM2 domain-containing membrane protein YozV
MDRPPKHKSLATAYLLLIFTGWFGGHHFYLKEPVIGAVFAVFFWTGVPLLVSAAELFTLPRRVSRVNRRIDGLYRGHLDPDVYPVRYCGQCGRNVALVSALRTGGDVNQNVLLFHVGGAIAQAVAKARRSKLPGFITGKLCLDCASGREPDQEWPAGGFVPHRKTADQPLGKRIPGLALGVALLAVGAGLLWFGAGRQAWETARLHLLWDQTPAKVVHAEVLKETWTDSQGAERFKGYYVKPSYEYQSGGRTIRSSSLAPARRLFDKQAEAREFFEQKAGDGRVTAFVDPSDPRRSYLSSYVGTRLISFATPGVALLLLGCVVLRFNIRR